MIKGWSKDLPFHHMQSPQLDQFWLDASRRTDAGSTYINALHPDSKQAVQYQLSGYQFIAHLNRSIKCAGPPHVKIIIYDQWFSILAGCITGSWIIAKERLNKKIWTVSSQGFSILSQTPRGIAVSKAG